MNTQNVGGHEANINWKSSWEKETLFSNGQFLVTNCGNSHLPSWKSVVQMKLDKDLSSILLPILYVMLQSLEETLFLHLDRSLGKTLIMFCPLNSSRIVWSLPIAQKTKVGEWLTGQIASSSWCALKFKSLILEEAHYECHILAFC